MVLDSQSTSCCVYKAYCSGKYKGFYPNPRLIAKKRLLKVQNNYLLYCHGDWLWQ